MDQTEPEDHGLLWHFPKCRAYSDLDRIHCLSTVNLGETPQHRGLGLVGVKSPETIHAYGAL
jgi:hypothetical protein